MFRVLCLTLVLISGVLCEHQLEKRQSIGFNVGGLVDAGVGALKNAQTAISTGINAFIQSIAGIANGFVNIVNFGGSGTRAAEFDAERRERISFLSDIAKAFGSIATEITKQIGAGFGATVSSLSNVANGFIGGKRAKPQFFADKDAQFFTRDLQKATFAFQQITNRFQTISNKFFQNFNSESNTRSKAEFEDAAFRAFDDCANEAFFFADQLDKLAEDSARDAPAFVRASGGEEQSFRRFSGVLKEGANAFRDLISKGFGTFGKLFGNRFFANRENGKTAFGKGQNRPNRRRSTTTGTGSTTTVPPPSDAFF